MASERQPGSQRHTDQNPDSRGDPGHRQGQKQNPSKLCPESEELPNSVRQETAQELQRSGTEPEPGGRRRNGRVDRQFEYFLHDPENNQTGRANSEQER